MEIALADPLKDTDTGRKCIECGANIVIPKESRRPKFFKAISIFCVKCYKSTTPDQRRAIKNREYAKIARSKPKRVKKAPTVKKETLPSTDPSFCKLIPCRRKAVLDGWCAQHYNGRHRYDIDG